MEWAICTANRRTLSKIISFQQISLTHPILLSTTINKAKLTVNRKRQNQLLKITNKYIWKDKKRIIYSTPIYFRVNKERDSSIVSSSLVLSLKSKAYKTALQKNHIKIKTEVATNSIKCVIKSLKTYKRGTINQNSFSKNRKAVSSFPRK